jgi:RimJ/RimL family protein N-acetyltransferase
MILLPASMPAPVLETERLSLRGHELGDFAECAAMWADPAVVRHVGGQPFSPQDVWTKLLRYVGHWQLLGYGYWVVRERASGRFVGEVGFADFKRALVPSLDGAPEAGWVLASWAHGRGLATEAVMGALAWGDAKFGTSRTACIIHAENLASIRVAAKCGYRESTRTTYMGQPTIVSFRDGPAGSTGVP